MVSVGAVLLNEHGERCPGVTKPADRARYLESRDPSPTAPPLVNTLRHTSTLETTADNQCRVGGSRPTNAPSFLRAACGCHPSR